MTKQISLWLMLGGAALSLYDFATTPAGGSGGNLYGTGKPLAGLRWNVYTTVGPPPKAWYVSASDAAAIAGAFFYFKN